MEYFKCDKCNVNMALKKITTKARIQRKITHGTKILEMDIIFLIKRYPVVEHPYDFCQDCVIDLCVQALEEIKSSKT